MFVQLLKEFMGRKAGERIDVSDKDAQALFAQQLAQPVTDDLITPAVQKAMEQAFQGFQKGQGAVIGSALKSLNRSRTPRPRPADTASPPSSAPAATATRTARPSATGSCTSPNRGT